MSDRQVISPKEVRAPSEGLEPIIDGTQQEMRFFSQ